jgi:hypothetical protein
MWFMEALWKVTWIRSCWWAFQTALLSFTESRRFLPVGGTGIRRSLSAAGFIAKEIFGYSPSFFAASPKFSNFCSTEKAGGLWVYAMSWEWRMAFSSLFLPSIRSSLHRRICSIYVVLSSCICVVNGNKN